MVSDVTCTAPHYAWSNLSHLLWVGERCKWAIWYSPPSTSYYVLDPPIMLPPDKTLAKVANVAKDKCDQPAPPPSIPWNQQRIGTVLVILTKRSGVGPIQPK
jgi:hypothetical protein